MAWEISITADGWQEIREKLDNRGRASLIAAITDDTFERVEKLDGQLAAKKAKSAERKRIKDLPHDVLADRAYELIEQTNTCDNGGFGYWIDREGYHKVWLK
ncbi:MAG TPA: hypothetical protein PLY87_19450 [Planctomycetaceae bacterium]|nr:hypothetical protein [Planctomycetaceae bacterium]